jgi:hypothetical protein
MKTVYINNKPPNAVRELLASNYEYYPAKRKLKELKRGDVILQSPEFFGDATVNGFSHVRTVVSIAKRKNCYKALLHEVDGYNAFVLTLLESNDVGEESIGHDIVFRPTTEVEYSFEGRSNITFPWKRIYSGKSYYDEKMRSEFGLTEKDWEFT